MLLNQRCTTCRERVTTTDQVKCETCGNHLHSECETFETNYECPRCSDELWVGAVEF
jgi:predicted RNA-binding Zn-ribbon protein involved in translation (DUF1610 family)